MATKALPVEPLRSFFCFDVETGNPSPDTMKQLEETYLSEWEPPANFKDVEKIESRRQIGLEKFRERAALLDAAPIMMCGLMFEDATFLLHGLKRAKPRWFGNRKNAVTLQGFGDERELMMGVSDVLNAKTTPDSIGVGHNIFGFDLRRLRLATVRHGLPLPAALRVVRDDDEDRQHFCDTMQLYGRYFGRSNDIMISQTVMLEQLGITPLLRDVCTGADVPKLLDSGNVNEVATKLLADLIGVRDAFLKMTGR